MHQSQINAKSYNCDAKTDRLRTALGYAREKLKLYREQHSGEYVGGIEYEALMRMIDSALNR